MPGKLPKGDGHEALSLQIAKLLIPSLIALFH